MNHAELKRCNKKKIVVALDFEFNMKNQEKEDDKDTNGTNKSNINSDGLDKLQCKYKQRNKNTSFSSSKSGQHKS